MQGDMKVAILLTTYNSSAFLGELFASLKAQTFRDWDLYVRDDLSTDDTRERLHSFMAEDSRVHEMDDGCKRGAMMGFLWLLQRVEADYYLFCDHDDVWKPDKIELSLKRMREAEADGQRPIVVHTDLEVVDRHLRLLEPSFWASQNIREKEFNNRYYHLVYNNVTGCTMMLNRLAREVSLPVPPGAQMHDSWVAAAVLWHGGRIYAVHRATILYRQHGANTIGMNELPSMANKVRRLRQLVRKTNLQYGVARSLSGMSRWRFWVLKMYYMTLIYLRDAGKGGKR